MMNSSWRTFPFVRHSACVAGSPLNIGVKFILCCLFVNCLKFSVHCLFVNIVLPSTAQASRFGTCSFGSVMVGSC